MRQPKPTHEKHIAPTVAKQNFTFSPEQSMQNRASAFLPKKDKNTLPIGDTNIIKFCLAKLVYHYFLKKSIITLRFFALLRMTKKGRRVDVPYN